MAVPEALLNAIGSSAPTSKNPLEKLGEVPFSAADGPAFSAAMREASAPTSASAEAVDDVAATDETVDAGKALPDLPDRPAGRAGLRVVSVSDKNLEEFAVGMGIDRDLARLLLSETAPSAEISAEAKSTPGTDPVADVANPAIPSVLSPPVLAPTAMSVTTRAEIGAMDILAARSASTASTDPTVVGVDVDVSGETVPGLNAPGVNAAGMNANASPIADEDLLLWRSRLSAAIGPVAGTSAIMSAATTEAGQSIDDSYIVATASGLAELPPAQPVSTSPMNATPASTIEQLRVRSTVTTASVASLESESPSVRSQPIDRKSSSESLPVLRGMMPMGTDTAPWITASGGDGTSGDQPQRHFARPSAISEMAFSIATPTLAESPDLSAFGSPISMTRDSPPAIPTVSGAPGDASRVLSLPDLKLTFDERVQAFSDAVAQRVLRQIRDANWSVSLQLEPVNLGAMDIDLTLRGNVVAANVGVANGEVRALLESGLPRLRESFESAGLQLAGWTFGQSGSRAFSEPARKMFSQGSLRGRIDDVDAVAEVGASRIMPRKDLASGAVDLFV